jgi:hypothetical protein
MDQKPTVGRIVHYHSYGTPGGEFKPEPRAAVVTGVYPEIDPASGVGHHPAGPEHVDLFVMNPTGIFLNRAVRYSETPKPGCWSWPPRS